MALYTFKLEKFTIYNTRSRHQDTDQGVFGLAVGTAQFGPQSFSSGDVNNGDHAVNLSFGPVPVWSDLPMAISYQIYNGDTGKLSISLPDLSRDLVEKAIDFIKAKVDQGDLSDYTDFPSDGSEPDRANDNFVDTDWIEVLEFFDIGSLIFPDCDGYTVIGTIGLTRSRWDARIDSTGGLTLEQTIRYPGDNSPPGCGSNSDYSVTWSVARKRATGSSLKQFLQENQITLHPGLRSLDPAGSDFSLRGLMQ